MSLLSSKFLRDAAIGGGRRLLFRMDENRGIGQKGIETLELAKKEVNEEVASFKDTYDTALQVGGNVGGGTFANYIFATEDIEYIAALQAMSPENRNEAFATLKKNFENLDDETKNSYEDYTKVAQNKFVADVNQSKINNGLVSKNNMGQDTKNFLAKFMFEPPTNIRERQEELVDFDPPALTAPDVVKGGFEAITPMPLNIKVTRADILGYLSTSADSIGFEGDQTLKQSFQDDYNMLVSPDSSAIDKTNIINKYYNVVLESKIPITPVVMSGNQDPISSAELFDMNEDENPPYTGETI
jgi:hypothetical protein|tara:strand:+ start:1028 stop:1927 length:900 start_codon:yes stop_codon:yes gene_type:complete